MFSLKQLSDRTDRDKPEAAQRKASRKGISFHHKLLIAMCLAILLLTVSAIVLVENAARQSDQQQMTNEFTRLHYVMLKQGEERRRSITEKSKIVASSPRIKGAMEREEIDLLYDLAKLELPHVLFGAGPAPTKRLNGRPKGAPENFSPQKNTADYSNVPSSFQFAFLDQNGQAIPNPHQPIATKWTDSFQLDCIPEDQKTIYVEVPNPITNKTHLLEVVITSMQTRWGNESQGAIAVAICVEEAQLKYDWAEKVGYFTNGRLYSNGLSPEESRMISQELLATTTSEPTADIELRADIDGESHFVCTRPFDEDPSIHWVSFFSLSDSIAARKAQQAKIALIGLITLLVGFVASYIISRLLSKPIEELAEASKENKELRDQAEEAYRQSEQRYRSLFENAVEGIFILSGDGAVVSANPALARICGFDSPETMMGETPGTVPCQFASLFADIKQCTLLVGDVMRRGSVSGFEAELIAPSGQRTWVSQNMTQVADPLDPRGYHYEGTLFDITHKKETELQMKELNAHLEKALSDLRSTQDNVIQQERLRALGEMASGVAHDFNNALSPIMGFSDLLLNDTDDTIDADARRQFLDLIQTSAQDAASVVSRLREFYKPDYEHGEQHGINLNELVDQTIHLTQPRWKQQAQNSNIDIQIQTDLQSDLPLILGEASPLRESMTNLIFNAVDAMPDGGTISLRTYTEGGRVHLHITDSGTGMTDEVRKNCLEPFFSTKGDRGTGLGLAMVFGIIQRHKGLVDIESEVGVGTTFQISFPIYTAGSLESTADESGENEATAAHHRPLRILLADDEKSILAFLQTVLRKEGHQTIAVEDGRKALNEFQAHPQDFDLVITDKAMPEMSGTQLSTEIKKISHHTPVIMLSGFGQFLDKNEMPDIDALASKPVSIDSLRQSIHDVLENAPAEAGA